MIDIIFCGLCALAMIWYCNRQWREKVEMIKKVKEIQYKLDWKETIQKEANNRIEQLTKELSAEVEKNKTSCATISTQHGIIHGQQVSIDSAMRILGQHQSKKANNGQVI